MAIELSNLTFTELEDIVPASGVAQILNTGIANTLAGDDRILGDWDDEEFYPYDPPLDPYAIFNTGTLNTGEGNDIIFGSGPYSRFGRFGYGIVNSGTLNAGEGDDIITGTGENFGANTGLLNWGTLNAGEGNDIITGEGQEGGLTNPGTLNTGDGNDIITGNGLPGIQNFDSGIINTGNGEDSIISSGGFFNYGQVFLGDGNDSINGGLYNGGTINTDNGADFIERLNNFGQVFLGNGNDSIIVSTDLFFGYRGNFGFIETGEGNDTITSASFIYSQGVIETGNGDDSIIVDGGFDDLTGTSYGIYNNGGVINMGDGNDSIIANESFESGPNSSGAWFLGEGEDYIKGFGSGDFYGGNGNDTLELTPGTYTVGIWGEGGESPIFTKGSQLMITSQFETLIAGDITYNFASLTAGQIITVA
jgi:hypothetical protein